MMEKDLNHTKIGQLQIGDWIEIPGYPYSWQILLRNRVSNSCKTKLQKMFFTSNLLQVTVMRKRSNGKIKKQTIAFHGYERVLLLENIAETLLPKNLSRCKNCEQLAVACSRKRVNCLKSKEQNYLSNIDIVKP